MKRIITAAVWAATFGACISAAPLVPTVQLIPSGGSVTGNPGTVVG